MRFAVGPCGNGTRAASVLTEAGMQVRRCRCACSNGGHAQEGTRRDVEAARRSRAQNLVWCARSRKAPSSPKIPLDHCIRYGIRTKARARHGGHHDDAEARRALRDPRGCHERRFLHRRRQSVGRYGPRDDQAGGWTETKPGANHAIYSLPCVPGPARPSSRPSSTVSATTRSPAAQKRPLRS